jgi:RNA polymerase sigma factor (sigma-70 family)
VTPATVPDDLLRELAPQVLGAVVRYCGDFDAAEDAVQEALLAATRTWPAGGVPANPRGWLIQAAVRRFTDAHRAERSRRRREEAVARQDVPGAETESRDDTLVLLFLCSHPALPAASAIALTLRAVGGLTTAEIAKAFLVPETTMAQRISRAKQRIRASGVPFARPAPEEFGPRLQSVLHVLYLMFNEGYASTSGPHLHRVDLSNEAIRLARAVHALLPGHSEVTGLLALMLLTDARRAARTGPFGELVPLAEQDRALWDRRAIAEGLRLVATAMSHGTVGEYQLQASIAALHDGAPRAEDTDWPQILGLYGLLQRITDNPVVALNAAVATAMVHGPAAGLAELEPLEPRLAGNHRLDAVRGHLREMLGEIEEAAEDYRRAAARTLSAPEKQYLLTKAASLPRAPRAGPVIDLG